ncbi:MAG: DUF1707 domain-containing protein [Pseudonocardiaceae bacterium]
MDDQNRRDQMRAADSDRERVSEQLRSAHAEGRLDLAEYDQRVQQAWAARTYGELEALTADLPRTQLPSPPASRDQVRPSRREHQGRGRRAAVLAWASVSAINFVIWVIVSLTTVSWIYPWWVWVAGPWGAVLLVGWLSAWVDPRRSPE